MPLTDRGREILARRPAAARFAAAAPASAARSCATRSSAWAAASAPRTARRAPRSAGDMFDVQPAARRPGRSRRGALGAALRRLMRHEPDGLVEVPARVTVYRTIVYDAEQCLGCGTCARGCPAEAIEARPPQAAAAQHERRREQRQRNAPRRHGAAPAGAALRVRRHHAQHRLRRARGAGRPAGRRRPRHPLVQPRGPGAACCELMEAGGGRAARLRRLLRGLRRPPLPEAPGARPAAGGRRHPRGLQLGARRRRGRRHRQGGAHHRLVDRLPGRAGRQHELRRAPRHRAS